MNLKDERAVELVKRMIRKVDVLIEPFRPGVMERLGLGPEVLLKINPRLIYARMTGWGQSGDPSYVNAAGHDANYLALSGTLSLFRRANDVAPSPPANFAGDYAGGATMLAMGVLLAHIEREKSGKGQVIDVAMVDGANYISLPVFKWLQMGLYYERRTSVDIWTRNVCLASGSHCVVCTYGVRYISQAIYTQTYRYECKDKNGSPFKRSNRHSTSSQGLELRSRRCHIKVISSHGLGCANDSVVFRTKTENEAFETNACVAPIHTPKEAAMHPHMTKRGSFGVTPGSNGKL